VTKTNKKKVVIIATESLLTAFRTLVLSAPNLDLLATGVSLSVTRSKIEKTPDIILIYLGKDRPSEGSGYLCSKIIEDIKNAWPDAYIVAIISDSRQREEVRTVGADKVLFEGITPAYLLASIETIELQRNR